VKKLRDTRESEPGKGLAPADGTEGGGREVPQVAVQGGTRSRTMAGTYPCPKDRSTPRVDSLCKQNPAKLKSDLPHE